MTAPTLIVGQPNGNVIDARADAPAISTLATLLLTMAAYPTHLRAEIQNQSANDIYVVLMTAAQ
jgi:hypothetical protein